MLKKKLWKTLAISTATLIAVSACAAPQLGGGETAKTELVGTDGAASLAESGAQAESAETEVTVQADENLATADADGADVSELFTDRDLSGDYDTDGATTITLNGTGISVDGSGASVSGSTVTITEKGTYILSGTLTDGQIYVDADDEKVQLVLAGVHITNDDSACILVKSADKVFITLADGTENTLSDTGETYVQTDDDMTVDGVIFSKDTLTVNGSGSLTIQAGYKHGIVSKDNLKVTGGSITITASGKGLQGKDSVRIGGGQIAITAGTEGIEGQEVYITDGDIAITARDDGINAASKDDNESDFGFSHGMMGDADESCVIRITGGRLYVNASGDGLDSNGYLYIDGGEVFVDGPTSDGDGALDCGISATITGGTVIAAGSSGMAETFGSDSTQYSVLVGFDAVVSGGTTVILADADGNEILSATPAKNYSSVVFSSPALTAGTYTVYAGDETVEVEISDISSRVNINGGFGGGFGGRGGFGRGGFGQGDGSGADSTDGQQGFGRGGFGQRDGEAPELPDGEAPSFGEGQTPPDLPDGETPPSDGDGQQNGQKGERPQRPDGSGGRGGQKGSGGQSTKEQQTDGTDISTL